MINTSDTSKKMILIMCALFVIECMLTLFFTNTQGDFISFSIGLFIGTAMSITKLIFLEKALEKSVEMEKKEATRYINKQYFLRYIVTVIILVVVVLNHPTINFIGVAIGLINMTFSAYIYGFILKTKK